VDGFAHGVIESKRGADAIDIGLPAKATGAEDTGGLRSPASGADGMFDVGQGLAAGGTNKIAPLATADAALWKQQVECYPLQMGYLRKHVQPLRFVLGWPVLADPGVMQRAAHDGLVEVDIAVPNFEVEAALRVGADPGLIPNRGPLTAEIGEGYQVASAALLALGETDCFHRDFVLLPTKVHLSIHQ